MNFNERSSSYASATNDKTLPTTTKMLSACAEMHVDISDKEKRH